MWTLTYPASSPPWMWTTWAACLREQSHSLPVFWRPQIPKFKRKPGLRRMREIVAEAKDRGYVTTLFGRRRYIPELKSSNYNIRQGAERIALNTPIQGTAADLIKLAMVRVDRALEEAGLQAKLILQVHDELIVECPPEEAEQVRAIVTGQMESVAQLSVPLVAEAKVGRSWYEAK